MYPVLIDLGQLRIGGVTIPLAIGGYGAVFVLGIILGWAVVVTLGQRVGPRSVFSDTYITAIIAGVIGAKLTNGLVFLPDILSGRKPLAIMLMGGGVWLGGVIPALFVIYWKMRQHGIHPGIGANIFFVAVPLAHGVGRIACLLGGCCYGAPCDLPWAVTYHDPRAQLFNGTPLNVPVHPVQLYEYALELMNFACVWVIWRRGARPWVIVAVWAGLYGFERFWLEFLRGDPRGSLGPFSTSQWISLALMASALAAFWRLATVAPPVSPRPSRA